MKTIGLLGGMSWESSVEYERLMIDAVRRRLGPDHSPDLLIRSYDFAEIEELQRTGRWEAAGRRLAEDARRLETAGADLIVLATNTMHRVAGHIEAAIGVPFIHIADTTAEAIRAAGLTRIGLLGTRYTMEHDFYRGRLEQRHGLEVLIPDGPDRTTVHDIIYTELVRGIVRDESRQAYRAVIDELLGRGAEGIIAGCTEIELLIGPDDVDAPYFPTTRIHALAAVDAALTPIAAL